MVDIGAALDYGICVLFAIGLGISSYTWNDSMCNYHLREFSKGNLGPDEILNKLRKLRRSIFTTKSTKSHIDIFYPLIERYKVGTREEQEKILYALGAE